MLESIARLGKVLDKKEQKIVFGGRLSTTDEIEPADDLCKNIIGMLVYTTSCNCANISENHEMCVL
ncbi:hypothetical protein [Aquimarina sp. 2201CG14-23]|uniref:hypothetical protein n=1 Tax=Aquimarina mycalae TaxID=3040073 RepID=UPI00247800AC|nr:hypothetical protein [Aquimarina sp. 2201CG14-23]MDH7445714.1 hypothetical protein [Aquimarina sp. 2201CG14-23]